MNPKIPSLAASTLLLSFTVQADNGLPMGGGHLYPAQSLSGSFGLASPMPSWPQSQPIGPSGDSAGAGNPPANQEERPDPDDDPEPLTDEPEEED